MVYSSKIPTKLRKLNYDQRLVELGHERHNFFVFRAALSWNVIPSNVINCSSLNGFKAALDKFKKNEHFM